ncbi:rhomboid family intramembrane serine protease [Streptomyces sp. NPDC001262]|uniref:rhomboid family intramembrane serine protease n=1 Tax=Streptomyces sp. NPDC001262 TaxID=3364552 RepID=UPI00369C4842
MNMHTIALYTCAAAVVMPGAEVITAQTGRRRVAPPELVRTLWGRPVPWAAAALVGVMAVMAVVQTVVPGVMPHLERTPDGPWWRALTALLVQTSGPGQLAFNLVAAAVVAPAAQRLFGPVRMPLLFVASGAAAHAVSMAGWSVHGGGDSVGLCGLVGALACAYALTGERVALRRLSLPVPAAGVVLCVLQNNHGIGVLTGSLLGAAITLASKRSRFRS